MKRLFCGAAMAAALLISASPSSAQVVNMTATLNAGEETPPPGFLSGAVGTATVSVDAANEEIVVALNVFNIPTTTTAGHIHVGPRGVPGGVIVNFPATLNGRTGDFALTFRLGPSAFNAQAANGIITFADALQTIVGGNAYVNIHTSQFPAGEIRGQLTVIPPR